MYGIAYRQEAVIELESLRAYDRVWILTAIGRHLSEAPGQMGRRKKRLDFVAGGFVYQLRVGEFRVFYDVCEDQGVVVVRHVRRKGRRTTGELL